MSHYQHKRKKSEKEMSRKPFICHLTILALLMGLTACVSTSGTTDKGGRSIKLETKGRILPTESRFNTFTFLKPSQFYETQTIERNNGTVWTELVGSKPSQLFITIEHVTVAWFAPSTERDALERDAFKQNFPSAARHFNDKDYIKIDQLSPRIKGWIASNDQCGGGYITKRLKTLGRARNDIGYSDTIVGFVSCGDKMTVSPAQFVQKIDLISDSEKHTVEQEYKSVDFVLTNDQDAAVIAINWPNVLDNQYGYLLLGKTHNNIQDFTIKFDAVTSICTGTFNTDDVSGWSGTWKLSCLNGKKADGEWTKLGKNKGKIATGKDNKGATVEFRFNKI